MRGFPGGSDDKESACNMEDLGSISGLERFPGEKGMATHSSILVWRIPWTEDLYSSQGHDELDMTEPLTLTRT